MLITVFKTPPGAHTHHGFNGYFLYISSWPFCLSVYFIVPEVKDDYKERASQRREWSNVTLLRWWGWWDERSSSRLCEYKSKNEAIEHLRIYSIFNCFVTWCNSKVTPFSNDCCCIFPQNIISCCGFNKIFATIFNIFTTLVNSYMW